ncbi:MAG: hypothetical protein IPP49_10640 [Saprospiraceae bacterium]|nr:hypothetical protein [Saprospiraceae bacterium]
MRITVVLAVILFTLFSCSKEDEWQTVNITGGYTNTPDVSAGFYDVALPGGTIFKAPKKYKVGGSDNLVGEIDKSKSFLDVKSVVINPLTGSFDLIYTISIFDKTGNKVDYSGNAQSYNNGTGLSWQHFTGGTGKYAGISGWLNTSITTNPTTGVHTITVLEGQATYKK